MMRAILFDMDGTLFDTERISFACWCEAARIMGAEVDMEQLIDRMYGMNREGLIPFFKERMGEDFDAEALIDLRGSLVRAHLQSHGVPKKAGIPAVLPRLRERGYLLAVVSSTPTEEILRILDGADMRDHFDLILGGDAVKRGKPAPDCYLQAAERLGVAPDQCVVVEDSKNGILSGSRAGMYTVFVPDRQAPDAEMLAHTSCRLPSLEELPAHMELLARTQWRGTGV